ncbi:hypothetical protein [Flavobacterium frigoris]|uniref:Uncharacterized protein n=1 Tax=Flavobacterium frigoris TaxID=229204 RepID=A0A1H9H7B7_FLAFI|nr:hypothetical protein [Flavobacterium frigoris]SEQ58118.1 hypothetical protein SAMN05444355_10347 [Flavobacterium frigoris]
MIQKKYHLEWFDCLIVQELNARSGVLQSITIAESKELVAHILKESRRIQIQIKEEIFSIRKKRQFRHLVRKYHSTFIYLLDCSIENQQHDFFKEPHLHNIGTTVIAVLEDLLSFVENRFYKYLSLDERVPITYQIVSKREILSKLDSIKKNILTSSDTQEPLQLVISKLYQKVRSEHTHKSTYREIVYRKELLNALASDALPIVKSTIYSVADQILISFNFNCQEYSAYLKNKILNQLDHYATLGDRFAAILCIYKEFGQLNCKPKRMFDPQEPNLKEVLLTWFQHEIRYLEQQIKSREEEVIDSSPKNDITAMESNFKMECDLSCDQIALILRAADESRVVKARSMSQVFKSIVPYLSTPFKKELSYQSVRSKSYNAEDRDKVVAIRTLEKMITKINSY